MSDPNFIILYVNNPPSSTDLYTKLLGKVPIEASPTFAVFALDPDGHRLRVFAPAG